MSSSFETSFEETQTATGHVAEETTSNMSFNKHHLYERSIVAAKVEDTSSNHDKGSLTSISTRVESHVSKETKSFLKDLSHLKLSWEDVASATNNFAVENIIEKNKRGTIYNGCILRSKQFIDIIVKGFYFDYRKAESKRFWTEVSMLSSLKHKNLVSLIGFHEDENNKIIIYKKEANESLKKYLSDETLTWMQRLKICVGVAKALSYIHYDPGRDFSVVHCNITSSNILLDDEWEPKLSGFELSLKNTVARRHRLLLTRDIIKNVYLDPKYKKTGGVTHKSNVYSFGVVLFEVLCGRSADDEDEDEDEDRDGDEDENGDEDEDEKTDGDEDEYKDELGEGLLSQLAKSHLDDMIDSHLRKQMDPESLKIFSETAYCCIKKERADRPHIDQVIKRLEKALELQWKHENPGPSRNVVDDGTSSNHLKEKSLEHLRIGLNDLKVATDNFDDAYCIGSSAFGKVYKAVLEHFDSGFSSLEEEVDKCDLPRKRSTVAIKRIHNQEGEQGFFTEIENLTTCKHKNVISLLGFCDGGNDAMILVYELPTKGSLEDYLGSNAKMTNLTWVQRIKICLDIAHGLNYIHTNTDQDKQKIIHRDIKSANILLGDNWKAKITGFGLSIFHPRDQEASTFNIDTIAGTPMYLDPEYQKYGRLSKKSDIYSFGVVLFEILTGSLAYDRIFTGVDLNGIAPIARHHFEKGTIMEIVDHKIKEETDEHVLSLSKGPNKESLDIFSRIAYQCIAKTQAERPSMDVVINELQKALHLQSHLQIRLKKIVSATSNFSDANLIKQGGFGKAYKGSLLHCGELIDILARRFNGMHEVEFWAEISMLYKLEHKNIASIVGYCFEKGEKIIIYEHAVHGSLDQQITNATLTWFRRLQICLSVARALSYIHYDVIHCNISSSKVLLGKDWEAKIFGFELSTNYPESWSHRLLLSRHFDKSGYIDPVYSGTTIVTPKYDVYAFGLIMFEVLCGRKEMVSRGGASQSLAETAKQHYQEKKLDELIDPNIRKQMDSQSLSIFSESAYNCLKKEHEQRPTMDQIVIYLEEALEHQWKRENIDHSTAENEGTSSNRLKRENLERLKIQFSAIMSATNDFNISCIGSGGYGMVYKAELDHLDIQSLPSIDGKTEGELPKRRSTVAIKRILNRQDEQGKQGFLAEIELLSSCTHHNIVSLLGFSSKDREMILVYEFLVNGSLDEYLGSAKKKINLTWNQRIRICLDIAEGLKYLHTNMEGKPRIIHRDIKSANVLLDENWGAKIADFGLSKFHPANQPASTIQTKIVAGTEVYLDPEYLTTGKYKKESDVYSFGVVLFEILSGRLAYDSVYLAQNNKGLAPIARRRFNEGTVKELIDPKMMEEDDACMFTLNRGPNQESLMVFSKIAYQCLAETQVKRPKIEVIIKELHSALNFQGETTVLSRFQLSDIVRATKNFAETCRIGLDAYGIVYKVDLDHLENKTSASKETNNGEQPRKCKTVAIKCISSTEHGQKEPNFVAEIEMRTSYKHPNIVSLLGFCDEGPQMILVYEHASNGSLADYFRNDADKTKLTWVQRLHKCLEIARGLDHLHTKMDSKQRIIHGDIRSSSIMLGKNLEAKIAYFGISQLHTANQEASTNITIDTINTKVYRDPEYETTGKLEIESDIYSFGVVLFEIFCGRLANDPIYKDNNNGLAPMVRRGFKDGTIMKMIDPMLLEETDEDSFTSNKGPNQDSLGTFLRIASKCLGESLSERPRMGTVIEELEKALNFQKNLISDLKISLEGIQLATQSFSRENCVGSGRDWEAYKGTLSHANTAKANGHTTIVAKRWNSMSGQVNHQFRTELDILFSHKHGNIIGLEGYCDETKEAIIVYKHAFCGSLNEHLKDGNLTWMKRLQICVDIASGLEFLHGGDLALKKLIHGDIKSSSILLTADRKAKISNFEFSSLDSSNGRMEHVSNNAYGTFGYLDPEYAKSSFLTTKSDIYSFGVILFEILCGRSAWSEGCEDHSKSLGPLAKCSYEEGKIDEMVFQDIKQQIVPQSLTTFANIACRCLSDDGYDRPEASEVVIQLKDALMFQDDEKIWEPKLPRNYKEIIDMSENPGIYSDMKKKDLYMMLSKGIFLLKGTVRFSLSKNGKENALISAKLFSYENFSSRKWRSPNGSRFHTVAKMMDVSNLNIQIKIKKTAFLSLNTVYGVHLVFKFCDPKMFSSNLVYVNLKYKTGSETSHAYFATQRDDGWVLIEMSRFLFDKEDYVFEVSLESISRYYCGTGAIYVQGIEFQAIDNVKQEAQQVPVSNSSTDQMQHSPTENNSSKEKFLLSEVNGKIHLMLSAEEVMHKDYELNFFHLKPSPELRFRNVMELLPRQVFRINYKIDSEKLSPDTKYECYLVYKLSETCHGLHCPVKVRDQLNRKNKETKIIYFRSPAPLNQHDASVPKKRKDGWMEVMVWRLNVKSKPEKYRIPMNLKLITYEGTMSGLTICGLDFQPL